MKHPLELIELAKLAKYKQPKIITNELKQHEIKKIQPYIDLVNNLNGDLQKINQQLKPLQKEYDREMLYREEMKQLLNEPKSKKRKK